mmetsp:Transcript_1813/g.3005  ORF Transcript_1813/g.3005 Transcript_1813/m.3005 type:complete len:387 (-) Transcript_1813:2344-3504(-)
MHPINNSNPTAAADAAALFPGGDRSLYVNSVDDRQKVWSPQPYNFSSSGQQQQQRFHSPPRSSCFTQSSYSSYSTPREQSEPPSSPPRISQNEGIGASSTNLSMMSSGSVEIETSPYRKMMILTAAASTTEEGCTTAERREEVVDGRAQNDDFMSRIASPTQDHLPLKKRKAIPKESVLLMEIDKLKSELGKAKVQIKVLEEDNKRLQKQQHLDATRSSFYMPIASSYSKSQVPFIPDLPDNTTPPPGKDMIQQQLHSISRVPSSSDHKLPITHDVFIQSHQGNVGRPVPYHPYATTNMSTDMYDNRQEQQRSQHIHRDGTDWARPPNNNNVDSSEKRISFALSFDADTSKSGSNISSGKESRGYNRCVSNRGRGSRPSLARWKTR